MSKQLNKSLNNLLIEQFRVTNNLFTQYSETDNDLNILYYIILITSIFLLISIFKIKIKL